MKCHVPHAAAEALRFRSCISFPPSRSVPLRSAPRRPRRRRPGRLRAAGPYLRAFCLRACARPRARFAAARFARLIARARRRTHLARPPPAGVFCGPQPHSCAETRERRPRGAASLCRHCSTFSQNASTWWKQSRGNFFYLPAGCRPVGEEMRRRAVAAAVEKGMSARAAGRLFDVADVSVSRWVREYLIPAVVDRNLCRQPLESSSPACGGGRVGGRFRASGSGGRSPAKPRHAERPSPGPSRPAGGETGSRR